jgi:hypothetical protein
VYLICFRRVNPVKHQQMAGINNLRMTGQSPAMMLEQQESFQIAGVSDADFCGSAKNRQLHRTCDFALAVWIVS